jgi:dUTP pyrophosphatase
MKRHIWCTAGPYGVPERKSVGAAAFDIASAVSLVVPGHTAHGPGTNVFDTELVMSIPSGYYGQIVSRSGLAFKQNLTAFHGVIDPDYRGPVNVKVFNWGKDPQTISKGDRIAQLLILPCEQDIGFTVTHAENLTKTERGQGGFGSTGTGTGTAFDDFATDALIPFDEALGHRQPAVVADDDEPPAEDENDKNDENDENVAFKNNN